MLKYVFIAIFLLVSISAALWNAEGIFPEQRPNQSQLQSKIFERATTPIPEKQQLLEAMKSECGHLLDRFDANRPGTYFVVRYEGHQGRPEVVESNLGPRQFDFCLENILAEREGSSDPVPMQDAFVWTPPQNNPSEPSQFATQR